MGYRPWPYSNTTSGLTQTQQKALLKYSKRPYSNTAKGDRDHQSEDNLWFIIIKNTVVLSLNPQFTLTDNRHECHRYRIFKQGRREDVG